RPPSVPRPPPTPPPTPSTLTLGGLSPRSSSATAAPGRVRTLIATGDVPPARLANAAATNRHDFLWPFRPTADYVKNADATFINLESPLLAGCSPRSTGMVFCGDTRFVDGLTAIGAKVANLANNHVN